MSERDEERRAAADASWWEVAQTRPVDYRAFEEAHLAGQLCGEQRAEKEIVKLQADVRELEYLNERGYRHCRDCCCAHTWEALGGRATGGGGIVECVTTLRERAEQQERELAELRAERDAIVERANEDYLKQSEEITALHHRIGELERQNDVDRQDFSAEIAALRARTCAVCGDTGELQDSQAWDCGQPNSECPYCPHKVDEYRSEIAALREELAAEKKRHDREEWDLSCEIRPLREEITALREAVRLLDVMAATMIRQFDNERLSSVLYETSLTAIRCRPEVKRALEEGP